MTCILFIGISLWRYVYFELTRGYWLEHDKARFAERRKRVYTFMKIPRELEKVNMISIMIVVSYFLCWSIYLILLLCVMDWHHIWLVSGQFAVKLIYVQSVTYSSTHRVANSW